MKVIKATIKKQVKGGYLLETENGKNAFMPNSLSQRSQSPYRMHDPLNIGTSVYVAIVKDLFTKYIVSRKYYLKQLPFNMPKNEPTKGIIAAIQGYGIFVDVGQSTDGFILVDVGQSTDGFILVDVGQSTDGFIHANNLPQPAESYKKKGPKSSSN